MPPGKFWNPRLLRCISLHFEVYFYFSLLFLGVNQFEQIWRKKKLYIYSNWFPKDALFINKKKKEHDIKVWPQLALSMSSTNVGKNRYGSISLILTLEKYNLITITFWQPLLFILSPSFLSIPATALHICSLRYYTSVLLGFASPFAFQKAGYTPECLFFYCCFCFLQHRTYFCQNF